MKVFIHILILSLIGFSCSDRELGDNYYFLPKYEALDIGYPKGEAIVYKSSQEYLFSEVIIQGDVLEVKADSRFIIAKRNPLLNRDKNSGVLEYYIILKKNDSLIGPLRMNKFEGTTQHLGINLEFE